MSRFATLTEEQVVEFKKDAMPFIYVDVLGTLTGVHKNGMGLVLTYTPALPLPNRQLQKVINK